MPSRKHYVVKQDSRLWFDHHAYAFLKSRVVSRIDNLFGTGTKRDVARNKCRNLPISFRKGFPELMKLAKELGVTNSCREFRLPRNISPKRNPITQAFQWR